MASPDRVNQRRETLFATIRTQGAAPPATAEGGRDNTVHDKISQFNNLSMSMQSRQLERKTADAALKRAMLGREEAEAEMKRLKEEARVLRQEIEEGKERERRVGERLETIMVSKQKATTASLLRYVTVLHSPCLSLLILQRIIFSFYQYG
jgi:seryl-tRNA synthetase